MGAQNPHRYVFLDGLRGLAAFAVILDHVPAGFLGDLLPGRYLAVPFFFVLSGFVMAHAYEQRLLNGMTMFELMRVRIIRLYPLYLLGFLLGLALAVYAALRGWLGDSSMAIGITAMFGLFMLPSPPVFAPGLYPFNGPSWSLGFELLANIVYGLIARMLTWRVFAVLLPVSAIGVLWTTFQQNAPWQWSGFWNGFWLVMYGFFAGVLIFRIGKLGKLPRWPAWIGVVALLGTIAIPGDGFWRNVVDAGVTIVAMPLIVACFANAAVTGLAAQVCGVLGLLSYGIYVLHVPIWETMKLATEKLGWHTMPAWGPYLAVAALTAVVVAVLDRIYDKPVRRWLMTQWKLPGTSLRKAPQAQT